MIDTNIVRLTTLWFVVLIFIQTESGGSAVLSAIVFLAILLKYLLPLAIAFLLIIQLFGE